MIEIEIAPLWNADGVSDALNRLREVFGEDFSYYPVDASPEKKFKPKVDIFEDKENIYFETELPGLNKEQILIHVSDDKVLSIKGEKKTLTEKDKMSLLKKETVSGAFSRKFQLPEYADIDNVKANYENGLLSVEIAKIKTPKPLEIAIN